MAQTTGPVLAIGGITIANQSILHSKSVDWRIPAATGLACLMFSAAERAWPEGARMLAWTALAAVCLTRLDPDIPSPVESAWSWWTKPERDRKKRDKHDRDAGRGVGEGLGDIAGAWA